MTTQDTIGILGFIEYQELEDDFDYIVDLYTELMEDEYPTYEQVLKFEHDKQSGYVVIYCTIKINK